MKRWITFYILFILMLGSIGIKAFPLSSKSVGSPRAPLHYVSSFSDAVKNDYSSRWNSGDIREMGSVVGEGLITLLAAGVKYADNAGRLGKTGAFIQKLRKIKNLKRLRKLKALKSEFRKGPGHMTRLRYEGASYHGKVKVGGKNPAPINDQAALDTLLQIKPTSPRRIGIDYDSGSFSVFDQTTEGVFHGHTRTWSELTDQMQRTLRQSGMVNGKGVIH